MTTEPQAPSAGAPHRLWRRAVTSPAWWHVASLATGAVVILLLSRDQWFFLDEWAFLVIGGPGLFEPHVGHWSTSPMLLTQGLREVFGLGSYLPFAVPVVLAHLAVSHLAWRLAFRARADRWIATASAGVLVFLGAGAENILWAFQVGFLTALALGLLALLLADRAGATWWRVAGVAAASVAALTWSGTAVPLVVATAALLWRRAGWRKATVYAGATASVYLAWYAAFALGNPNNPDTGGIGIIKLLVKMPQFLGVMVVYGWQSIFPVFGIGLAVAVALVWWLARAWRRRERIAGLAPALMAGGGALVFALMAAYSRAEWSLGAGRSSRYVYVLAALLLPLCAVALSRLVAGRRSWAVGAGAALVALAGYQCFVLVEAAGDQAVIEQAMQAHFSAAIVLYGESPAMVDPTAPPEPRWAPDATVADLLRLHQDGYLPVGAYTDADLEQMRSLLAPAGASAASEGQS